MSAVLPRSFYARDTVRVARELLGMVLVRDLGGLRVSGVIVETEAYCGERDEGSHAYRGLTPRTRVMFGPPGQAYVYLIYGMHYCLNTVTESEGAAGAVLVRAIHPLEGLDEMRRRRGRPDPELTNGPAKLCQALGIDGALNGADLCIGRELWLERGAPVADSQVAVGPRVGLNVSEEARALPWRFAVAHDPWVSRPRPPVMGA
ncbi:MAG: DNA-3-methyladenine glycosylase [Anaerolineae bacterium]|nr:DNA-3-methyladenine glycosylase [Anaerolineae bacterium]